ncbi:hypothetical protein VTN02DRAFT_6853 [Thermoascus thermophilus]
MSSSNETPEQKRARLAELTARASAKDAIKDFDAAAELYSQATELQAELNGEMSVDNADLLYAYGKSLYNVAVSKSDVLGSKLAGEPTEPKKASRESLKSTGSSAASEKIINNAITGSSLMQHAEGENKTKSKAVTNQPYFQFTGDENFDESDSDEEDDADRAADEEEEDDFANAFEVLDLARILLLRKLDKVESDSTANGKSSDMPPEVKRIKERLADTYDLQAEISLEGERFMDAVTDLKAALELKQALFPLEDPSVAECHYKLSLALEFSSVNRQKGEGDEVADSEITSVDDGMRKEAAKHMETAIESCKIRMAQEQKKLDSGEIKDEDKIAAAKRKIANVKDIVTDMEQRLHDLRRPPVSINDLNQNGDGFNTLGGILGQLIGQSPSEQKARLEEATQGANDLSALVRKKPPVNGSTRSANNAESITKGKRSAEDATCEGGPKRAKVEDTA